MTRNISETHLGRSYRNSRLRNSFNQLKMAKTKSVVLLCMIITACALIFSLSDAYPTPEEDLDSQSAEGNVTESDRDNNGTESYDIESSVSPLKDPKLVITHVVKTLEFEVDEVDSDENSTETTENYEETDIKLLNVNLLRNLVNNIPTGGPSTQQGIRYRKSAENSKELEEADDKTEGSTEISSTKGDDDDKNES